MSRQFLPQSRHGIVIDVIMIAVNVLVFPLLSSRMRSLFEDSFGNVRPRFEQMAFLMFLLIGGRLFGLYLKRFSLQAKQGRDADTTFPLNFILFNVPVLIMTGAFAAVLLISIFGNLGLAQVKGAGSTRDSEAVSYVAVFLIIGLVALEVYLLFRLTSPLTDQEKTIANKGHWIYGQWGEFVADFGLFMYMMIWQIFYFYVAEILLTPAPGVIETNSLKIGGIVFAFFAFVLFYLGPRAVFLIEDRKAPATWLFILGVFLSSVISHW